MLQLVLQSETLQNGETSRNYNWQLRVQPAVIKKEFYCESVHV